MYIIIQFRRERLILFFVVYEGSKLVTHTVNTIIIPHAHAPSVDNAPGIVAYYKEQSLYITDNTPLITSAYLGLYIMHISSTGDDHYGKLINPQCACTRGIMVPVLLFGKCI